LPDIDAIRTVLQAERERLFRRANVLATGIGYKVTGGRRTENLAIVCSVQDKLPRADLAARDLIPAELNGMPTDVVETGRIRLLQDRRGRHRPAPGGVSIGHRDITAGTLGCLVRRNGQTHILSNNHVLADSNEARIGDAILQPGAADGGRYPGDHIADLADYVPIEFQDGPSDCPFARRMAALLNLGCRVIGSRTRDRIVRQQQSDNLVDAAIARPLDSADLSPEILEIGRISGTVSGELGMAIRKSGRTTGLTSGEIEQVDATVNVQFGGGRVARFSDQLVAGAMSQGGDSGSVVLDEDDRVLGLLFAGSRTTTIINRIEHVFSALELTP
jgi:hypothetical protein